MGMDSVELFMDIEDAFGIEIPERAAPIKTMGRLRDLIVEQLAQRGPLPDDKSEEVWRILLVLVKRHTRISRDKIKPESRLVEDLGLD